MAGDANSTVPLADGAQAVPASAADDYILRARSLIESAIRRRWAAGMLTRDPDGVFTAILGAEHVERLLETPPVDPNAKLIDDYAYDPAGAIGRLMALLQLTPSETDLLALLLACETDPVTARLVGYLGGNQAQFMLTFDLAFDVIYRSRDSQQSVTAAMMHRDLATRRPLRRLRFILVDGAEGRSALAHGLRLHPRTTSWLLGQQALDADLVASAQLAPPGQAIGEVDAKALETLIAAYRVGGRLAIIDGPQRSGREMLIGFAARRLEKPLLVIRGRGLGPDRMVAAFREALLQSALLAFTDADEIANGDVAARFCECLEVYGETVALIGLRQGVPELMALRPSTTIQIEVPSHEARLELWRKYLGEDTAIDDEGMRQIAALYNLGVGGIVAASLAAREQARFAERIVQRSDVGLAVRQLFDTDLSAVATRAEVTQDWEDVVLPDDLGESVVGILDRIRYRNDVLGNWGFARKMGKGLGLTVLFSGEPGTGKSMVAGLIARELGLDLYVVDLARVTSKWLGETEKNLSRAFDAAEAGHVLLLFDEADSILAKRSGEIRTANDRHANLETNFILARLEQFQGIAFFTTNLSSAIDPAIQRRMSATVKFSFPDLETRAELWRRMIPQGAPIEGAVDFEELARKFEVSGGFIRNIVLRAAFLAKREGSGITQAHLERAAKLEYTDRGSLVAGGRLV